MWNNLCAIYRMESKAPLRAVGRSQPQALDVLDTGEDHVAAAAQYPGQGVDDLADQALHLLARGRHRVDVQLVLAGDPVDLGDRLVGRQQGRYLGQGVGAGLDLKITADRAADLLRVDDGGVFLDHPALLQRLDPRLDRHPADPHRLPDIGIGHPGVLDQQLDDLTVQAVQSFQKHGEKPPLSVFRGLL